MPQPDRKPYASVAMQIIASAAGRIFLFIEAPLLQADHFGFKAVMMLLLPVVSE